MTFYHQLDAVAEAAIRLDHDLVQHPPREQAKAVAGIPCRQSAEMMQREIAGAYQQRLEPWAAYHAATGHEAAGANGVVTIRRTLRSRKLPFRRCGDTQIGTSVSYALSQKRPLIGTLPG